MKRMKRTVAAKKMEDGDSGIVGNKKMDFQVYKQICELFLKEEGEEFLFACCFLVLEWNLMLGSNNIVHAHLFHITWEDQIRRRRARRNVIVVSLPLFRRRSRGAMRSS